MRLFLALALLAAAPMVRAGPDTEGAGDRGNKRITYPVGDVFRPLLADPKEPRFFVSYQQTKAPTGNFKAASVGVGHSFGIFRWTRSTDWEGWQLSWFAGLFSQFNTDADSNDLLNTDFTVGFPVTYRRGPWSARIRLFHQSSHLGDELLLGGQAPARENLGFEKIDAVVAYRWRHWRAYAGGGYLLGRDPKTLKRKSFQAGMEYYGSKLVTRAGRLVGGLDIQWIEEREWGPGVSFKIGLELGAPYPARRGFRIMFEAYDGFNPYGQFYKDDIRWYGVGLSFDF